MNPIDYLRGVVMRDEPAPEPTSKPEPLPTLNWTNSVRTVGACPCDVIFSECQYPDKHGRLPR